MAAEVRIRSFSSTDDDYTTAFLQTSGSDNCSNGSNYHPYVHEEDMSTEEDDVFIRDPVKKGENNNKSLSKPLMHPRHRARPNAHIRWTCQRLLWPALYLLIIIMALAAFVCLIIYIVNVYAAQVLSKTSAYQGLLNRLNSTHHDASGEDNVIGCSHITVEDIWVNPIAKLLTESSIRLVDVNQDGTLDAILGFATGADKHQRIPEVVCDMYFNGSYPCSGGLLALDGKTGRQLWRHYTIHEIYAVTCNFDFDKDGVLDCLGAGRAGIFQAVSGRTGRLLWDFQQSAAHNKDMNLYTAQVISDVDEDGTPDVLQVHGGDPLGEPGSETRLSGKILLFSGATGQVIQEMGVPDGKESYFSPVIYSRKDGTKIVLFGTGGETHPGALWVVPLSDLIKGRIDKAQRIYWDHFKGVMTPPILIDITRDGVRDIVIAPFNSTLIAIDGETYRILWKFTYTQSETYCTPSPGYYNDDDVPDFMVKFAFGPGFPIYYHAMTTVIDGRNGQPLIQPFIKETVGGQTSPLTVSVEGQGNDLFLYMIADCLQHEAEGGEFTFVKGTNVHEQSRSDFCRLRFKSRGFTKMLAVNRHTSSPGVTLYNSEERKVLEHSAWVNTTAEALRYLSHHPEKYAEYREYTERSQQIEAKRTGNQHKNFGKVDRDSHDFNYIDKDNSMQKTLINNIIKKYDIYNKDNSNGLSNHDDRGYYGNSNYNSQYDVDGVDGEDASEFGYLQNLLKDKQDERLSGQVSDVLSSLVNRNRGQLDASQIGQVTDRGGYLPLTSKRESRHKPPSINKRILLPVKEKKKEKMQIYDESLQSLSEITADVENNNKDENGNNIKSGENAVMMDTQKDTNSLSNSIQNLRQKFHIPKSKSVQTSSRHHILSESRLPSSLGGTSRIAPRAEAGSTLNIPSTKRRSRASSPHKSTSKHSVADRNAFPSVGKSPPSSPDYQDRKHWSKTWMTLPVVERFLNKEKERLEKSSLQSRHQREPSKRKRRHVGPHDSGGLQRLISTGTLAPPLLAEDHPDYQHSMDVIFAVYWFYPAKTKSILPEDQRCIDALMANETIRFSPSSKYYGMDHDAYQHAVVDECLDKSGHQMDEHGEYESQLSYNPYNVHMGQMTVYRLRLKCTCKGDHRLSAPKTRCARILPFSHQQWPAYMGRHADSIWHARDEDH